jgi:hypothetical protein
MSRFVLALFLQGVAFVAQAQFDFTTNNGAITITAYTGSDTAVTVPGATNGWPVTVIGNSSFGYTVISSVALPDSVISIGDYAFAGCFDLTNIMLGDSLASVGQFAFDNCLDLATVTLPGTVTNLEDEAFAECASLTAVYFQGNAPNPDATVFLDDSATVYYLPGTAGWGPSYGGAPAAAWMLPQPLILDGGTGFGGPVSNFCFTISWATNIPVVVEACTNLADPMWQPLATNTLVNGTDYFCDPAWTNNPCRFYRVAAP